MAGRLAGKRAFVTGAGQGIGRAMVLAFAREGAAAVVAASRTYSKMLELAQLSPEIVPVALDMTDAAAVDRTLAEAGL